MSNSSLPLLLDAATEAALLAGNTLMSFYGKLENIENKQFKGDLVTEADIASEKNILQYNKTFNIIIYNNSNILFYFKKYIIQNNPRFRSAGENLV